MGRARSFLLIWEAVAFILLTRHGSAGVFRGGEPFRLALEGAPAALLLEDFDGDGRLDLAVARFPGQLAVLVNAAQPKSPGFEGFLSTSYDVGLSPLSLASGDLDGSGSPDLVVANSGSSTVSVLLNRGDGSFAPARDFEAGAEPRALQVADLDGDGRLDVVTSNLHTDDLTILLGDGDGGFRQAPSLDAGDNPHALVVEDFDGDGRLDLAVAHSGGVGWRRGLGNGSFAPVVETRTNENKGSNDPRLLACGDFNRDGRPDLSLLTDDGDLLVLENTGSSTFQVHVVALRADNVVSANVGRDRVFGFLLEEDFDRDGNLDLIVQRRSSGRFGLSVHGGDGNGSFLAPRDFFLDDRPMAALALGDLDGDGILDALTARTDPEISLLVGTAPGRLDLPTHILLGERPRDLLALDVDGDADADLVALTSRALQVVRVERAARFEDPQVYELPGLAYEAVVAGDFDGDGAKDLAVGDFAGGKIVIVKFSVEGAPSRTVERSVLDSPENLAAADFDNDKKSDLVVTHLGPRLMSVLFGPGSEDPSAPLLLTVESSQTTVDAGDMDGDANADIAVGSREGVRLLFGDGHGEFPRTRAFEDLVASGGLRIADVNLDGAMDLVVAAASEFVVLRSVARDEEPEREVIPVGPGIDAFDVADVDRDGHPDLVSTASDPASAILVFRGRATGGFESAEVYGLGVDLRALVLADLDGGGNLDCAVADFGAESLSILYGASAGGATVFRRGDVDNDGRAVLTDAVVILERLFLGGKTLACPDAGDTDDDGRVTLTDAVHLLLYLFQSGEPPPEPGPDACGSDPSADGLGACRRVCR